MKNAKEFWVTIKSFNKKTYTKNLIPICDWENFYRNIYPNVVRDDLTFFGVYDANLDCEFTDLELIGALKKMKDNKAPGTDMISIDFYKKSSQRNA